MYSVIVVPPSCGSVTEQLRIGAGERIEFGRAEPGGGGLVIAHAGVPRIAGEIAAHRTFWLLSNLSEDQTYVVENPEGSRRTRQGRAGPRGRTRALRAVAGDPARRGRPAHLRRMGAAARLPHRRARRAGGQPAPSRRSPWTAPSGTSRSWPPCANGACAVSPAPRCPPSRRSWSGCAPAGPRSAARPSTGTSTTSPSSYGCGRARTRPSPAGCTHGKKESLASLALRFDLVREDDLVALAPVPSEAAR